MRCAANDWSSTATDAPNAGMNPYIAIRISDNGTGIARLDAALVEKPRFRSVKRALTVLDVGSCV